MTAPRQRRPALSAGLVCASALALAGGSARAQLPAPTDGPPGLVWISPGRARVGTTVKDIERLLDREPTLRGVAGALIAETPAHDRDVAGFWLMPTEVTCEQYAEYLRATGERAPEPWCAEAIRAASEEHVRAVEERARAARAEGRTPAADPGFDAHAWWLAHGRGAAWSLPEEERSWPVVFVDWNEARAYARWAGLRLMDEAEYARAARGETDRPWPWGADVRAERYAVTSDGPRRGRAAPVASMPAGATRAGVYDLAGNVWEWTSSAYLPFPGHEPKEFQYGAGNARQRVTAIAPFDREHKVAVGGSFQNPLPLCRASVRFGLAPGQRTGAVGLRCAASARPGQDLAQAVDEAEARAGYQVVTNAALPRFAPWLAVAADGWRTHPSDAAWTPPAGYAVIAEHRAIVFAPVASLAVRDPQTLDRISVDEAPVVLGFLHATLPLEDPPLAAGTYVVTWRAKGVRRTGNPAALPAGAPLEERIAFDPTRDHAILCEVPGRPLAALPWSLAWSTERDGRVGALPAADGDGPALRRLRFEAYIPSETSKRGCVLTFEVAFAPSEPDVVWR